MSRIRERLEALADRLGLDRLALAVARRRYKANQGRALTSHSQQIKARKAADQLRKAGRTCAAKRQDSSASRAGIRAHRCQARAQWWLGHIKTLIRRIHNLETNQTALEAKAEKWRRDHGITIEGDKATGGTKPQRIVAVAHASSAACASGRRSNFYDQLGRWDVDHCITGPAHDCRDDCSSWFTSDYKSAGLADPNGERYTAGYTGTLGVHGTVVSRSELKGGEAVLYGPYPHHHVELVDDPSRGTTIGHGSAPVDAGVFDLFGDGDFTFRSYV